MKPYTHILFDLDGTITDPAEDHFTLWQRTDYNSTLCFNHRILDLPFGVLAAKDSGKDKETAN